MSLLEALLLDPYRDPREVWIALRTDGQQGSGTLDDPYDGGTHFGPSLAASITCDRREFVVAALGPLKGLTLSTVVTISGVTGPDTYWGDVQGHFNGEFYIAEILETQLADDHQQWPIRFTLLCASVPAYPPAVQHSFTGPVLLKYDGSPPEFPKDGLQIRILWPVAKVTTQLDHGFAAFEGATIDNVSDPSLAGSYAAIGPRTQDRSFRVRLSAEPADITTPVPCRVRRLVHRFDEVIRSAPDHSLIHLGPGTFQTRGFCSLWVIPPFDFVHLSVGCALRSGQRLLGLGIDVTVLKLVLPLEELNAHSVVAGASVDHAEVADLTTDCNGPCHVAPFGNWPMPVTCCGVTLRGSFNRVRRVRVINFCTQSAPEGFPISLAGNIFDPHDIVFSVIEDCIVEKPSENNTHETTLTSAFGEHASSNARSCIVRHNYHNCEYSEGRSSAMVAVDCISTLSGTPAHFTLTTKQPHKRLAGNNVLIAKVLYAGDLHPYFNRPFLIESVDSPVQLTCKSPNPPASIPAPDYSSAVIGPDFFGRGSLSGTGCVTEGNAHYDCHYGCYQDTGSTRDVVLRDNYASNIAVGMVFDFNPGVGVGAAEAASVVSLRPDPSNYKIAVCTTTLPHGLREGDAVVMAGALIGGNPDPAAPYRGTFTVLPDTEFNPNIFRYEMKTAVSTAADPADSDHPVTYAARFQVRRIDYENNVCDLYAFDSSSTGSLWGIGTNAYTEGPPFMFPQGIIRENIFRYKDDAPAKPTEHDGNSYATRVVSFEDTLIEDNFIGLTSPLLVHYLFSRNMNAFNNVTPSGAVVPLFDALLGGSDIERKDTLEDKVADALLLAML